MLTWLPWTNMVSCSVAGHVVSLLIGVLPPAGISRAARSERYRSVGAGVEWMWSGDPWVAHGGGALGSNPFQRRRFASQTKPLQECHPERSEGSLAGQRSFAPLRMTKRDDLLFEMYCPQRVPLHFCFINLTGLTTSFPNK